MSQAPSPPESFTGVQMWIKVTMQSEVLSSWLSPIPEGICSTLQSVSRFPWGIQETPSTETMKGMLQVRTELHSLNRNILGRGGGRDHAQSFITQRLLGSSPYPLWDKHSLHAALAWPEASLGCTRTQCPGQLCSWQWWDICDGFSQSTPVHALVLPVHLALYVCQPTQTQDNSTVVPFFWAVLLTKLSLLRIIPVN